MKHRDCNTFVGRSHTAVAVLAKVLFTGMILWLPRWFRQDGPLTQDEVAEQIAKFALGGLIEPRREKGTGRK